MNLECKKQPLIDTCRYSTESKQRVEEWRTYGVHSCNNRLSLHHNSINDVGYTVFWRAKATTKGEEKIIKSKTKIMLDDTTITNPSAHQRRGNKARDAQTGKKKKLEWEQYLFQG